MIRTPENLQRVAMLSVHGCPMALPGVRSAGGMNVYLKQIAAVLAETGLCVDIFTRSHQAGGPELVSLGAGARVVHIPAGPPELPKEGIYAHLPEFLEGIERFQAAEGLGYDLVHSHYWLSACAGGRLTKAWDIPHVTTFHTLALAKGVAGLEDEPPERLQEEMAAVRHTDGLVTFTPDEGEMLVSRYDASPSSIFVAPGGVDLQQFRPGDQSAARTRLGLERNGTVALYAGRIEPFKGADVLLRAIGQMRWLEDLTLVVVGGVGEEDPEVVRLQLLARELGIESHIRWQSACPQERLPDYYTAADVCVVPSYHESFGFVALEAMACSTPVIAAPVGGLAWLIRDGETGRLVRSHTPEAFASCLDEIVDHPERQRQWGHAAREWACRFPWGRAANDVRAVYDQVLSAMVRRPAAVPCDGRSLPEPQLVPAGDASVTEP